MTAGTYASAGENPPYGPGRFATRVQVPDPNEETLSASGAR